jgi:predicted transcriptional regulator
MAQPQPAALSGLEHKVMQVVWRKGLATAEAVRAALGDGNRFKDSTVRTILRRLEEKGYVTHQTVGRSYVYSPTVAQRTWRPTRSAASSNGCATARLRICFWAWSTAKWFRPTRSNKWPSGLSKTRKPAPATRNVEATRKAQDPNRTLRRAACSPAAGSLAPIEPLRGGA